MSIIQYRKNPSHRFSPLAQLSELHREMNRLFEGGALTDTATGWGPALDVIHDTDRIEVVVELPGLRKEDIQLSLQDGVLTVSGERKAVTETQTDETHRTERFFGKFQRSIELPAEVNPDKVDASYKDGVLTVTLAKADESKPKQITIQTN